MSENIKSASHAYMKHTIKHGHRLPEKVLYHTLKKIHSSVKTAEGLQSFKANDVLGFITQLLSKPNKDILNVSLEILAACCTDSECCTKVISGGVIKHLVSILNSINQEKIVYRCYKLISILVQYPHFCTVLVANSVHQLMAPVMNGNPPLYTQLMGLKIIRYLWLHSSINEKKTIAQGDLLKCLNKYLASTHKEVQKSVLKDILCLCKVRPDVNFLKQFIEQNTLTLILSKEEDFPELVLEIICYLSEIKSFYFEIAKAGAIEIIFKYVRELSKNFKSANKTKSALVLRTVNRLCNEPKSREKLCNISDAFDVLLHVIENCSNLKFRQYSVLILTTFIYNERSLPKLLKRGLIGVLVVYLRTIIKEQASSHGKNSNKSDLSILFGSSTSPGRISPLSDSGASVGASCSPTSDYCERSPTSSVDSAYSPVYSPFMDETDDDELEEDGEKSSVDGTSSVGVADATSLRQEEETVFSITEEKIFNMLRQLTYKDPIYDLCEKNTWETFLDYLVLVRKSTNQVTSLISSIAANNFFFKNLLDSQFALKVHKKLCRPDHTNCSSCQEMNTCGTEILSRYQSVAESSYGNQILRMELTKQRDAQEKLLLALTIPHIVKDVLQLEEYCLRYKVLQIITESLEDENTDLLEEKVASLYLLAASLYLESPRIPCELCRKCDVASLVKEGTISFLLDDKSTVTANKRTICEKSEFFEAMFRCGFQEAKQSTVRLSSISSECLQVLFRLLYSYCDCIVPKNIVVLLELIVQTDRFLVPALSEKLLNITMNDRLNYKNCHLIYDWAIENGQFLPSSDNWPICVNVIKYILINEMSFEQRAFSFGKLLKSSYKSHVLKDIKDIIKNQLTCKEVKMKSHSKHYKEIAAKRCKLGL